MADAVVTRGDFAAIESMPRASARPDTDVDGIRVGEWTLTRAAFTDRHHHAEINVVVAGELHVTCEGQTHVLGPGERIVVPGGSKARYAAPEYARMVYIYAPGERGLFDAAYEEL